MDDEELIKEATETSEREVTSLIDRPLFVRGYITGAKAKLSELDNQYKNLCKAKEIINELVDDYIAIGYAAVDANLIDKATDFLKEKNNVPRNYEKY